MYVCFGSNHRSSSLFDVSIVPPTTPHLTPHTVLQRPATLYAPGVCVVCICQILSTKGALPQGTGLEYRVFVVATSPAHKFCRSIRKEERRRRSAPDVNGALRTAAKIQRQAEHDQQVINYSTPLFNTTSHGRHYLHIAAVHLQKGSDESLGFLQKLLVCRRQDCNVVR